MKRTTVFKRMMALVLSIMMFVSVPINTFATEITDSPVLEQTDNQAESLKLEDVETTELEQLEVVLPEAVSEPEDADTIEIKDNTPDKVSEETTDSKDEDITILENTEKTETTTENSEIAKDVVDEAVVLVEGEKIDEEIVSAPIFYSETVDGYEITINAEEGIFPENTTVKIVSLEQKEELEQVEELISEELEEEKTIEKFVAFDISFWNEDKEIEPEDGSVKVSIKLAEDMLPEASEVPGEIESDEEAIDEESIMCEEAEYQVFHVDDEDNVETIESEIQDEIIEFESDSFSTYVIAKVYTAANVNIYSNSYSFTDIRTGTTKTLKGSDGKVDVIVFGGVPSCGNTTAVLKTLSKFQNQIGASRLGIYVVDVGGNSVSTMKSWLSSNGIPSDIVVASYNSSNHYNLRQTCLNASGFSSGTWTMPCVAYKNASGRIIEATRGYVSESEIKAALKAAGLDGFGASDIYNVSVSGKINHRISKKIFDKVNQHRAANGLSALAVDYDLIDAADLRAAECSVFYDSEHRRPTGEACFSVHNKVSGENIAYIGGSNISRYTDDQLADLVMSKWMNSPGHKANILRSTFTSIGVGVFITSNGAYFSQDFGSGTDINRTSYVEEAYNTSRWFEASHSVLSYWDWPDEYTSSSERTRFPVEVRPDINNPDFPYTELDPYTFNWSSSDPSIVDIDDTGLTTHYGIGRVIITATPKYSSVNNIVFSTQYTSTKITSGAKKYPDGLNQGPDGNWYLYRNNAIDYSYSGLYYDSNLGWRKVTNGALDFSYNGLCYDSSIGWWKVTNGAIDFSYNGLCYDSSIGWWKVTNGTLDFSYNGLCYDSSIGWWKVTNGTLDFSYNGLCYDSSIGWWKVTNGAIDFSYNGLYYDSSIGWWKVTNGAIDFSYNGLYYDSSIGWWKVTNGALDFSYNGLCYDSSIGWWKVTNGALDFSYNGLCYDSSIGWWKVTNGAIDFSYNGLCYDSSIGWWKITNGAIDFSYSDIYRDDNIGWWLIQNGQINFSYTGVYRSARYGLVTISGGAVQF